VQDESQEPADPEQAAEPDEPVRSEEPVEDDTGDDLHRRFREALDRKKATRHDPHADGTTARGVGPASNDKRQRQFRRKSGG
jgi:Family of unknown function (DUF5302)